MAAPADPAAVGRSAGPRATGARTPRGWATIARKEFADHVESTRFLVLLVVVGLAAVIPLQFVATEIGASAPRLAGRDALFLALFVVGSASVGGITTVAFVALLVPLVGIAFGFDAINGERTQGTLSRLLAQPIHRDDVVNGKFAAGIAVIGLVVGTLVLVTTGLGIARLGIVPAPEELARVLAWLLATVLYASFWLAFALLLSVAIRGTATAALTGFGTWLGVILLGSILLPLVARALFPASTSGSADEYLGATVAQEVVLRVSPATLYQDIVTALMNPSTANVIGVGNLGQYAASQEVLPTLLSFDQSVLVVWPQIVLLVAMTVSVFAGAYVAFLRQEVRS